jgi:protein-S-isoprenylcysteine O-methyltransferase Ste14
MDENRDSERDSASTKNLPSDDVKSQSSGSGWTVQELGEKLFELRDYTPIPLIALVLFTAEPTVRSATLGTLMVAFGELFRVYSVAFIGSVSRTRNTSTTGSNLIKGGPFSLMRNPLYVGNFFITVGLAVFSGVTWVVLLTCLLFSFQYYCIVKHEEGLLIERFGAEYESYMKEVPAWIPSRMPNLNTLEWPDTFSPALKSERRTLLAIGFMLLALCLLSGGQKPSL